MIDSESLYKVMTNYTVLAVLLVFIILSIRRKIPKSKIGQYGTLKYFTMAVLIVVSFWFFVYSNINNSLNAKDNLQLVVVLFASLSIFLIALDNEYTKSFSEIKDIVLDSKIYVPFAQKVGDSKFQFKDMVNASTTSIFIIGPNLAFLSKKKNKEEMKEILFKKFIANPAFEIKILIMDPANKDMRDKNLGFTEQFWDELDESVKVFKQWAEDARKKAEGENASDYKFNVRVTDILTLSLLFRDKETPEGCVLVTPIPNGSEGANRSCFLIKKKSYEMAFYEYYDSYNKLFKEKYSKSIYDAYDYVKKPPDSEENHKVIKDVQTHVEDTEK
ncbi:hypothetical protein MSLAZ_0221 [Methanosarcina lacustris Z-7289]|uniref:Uncharacterized protein n=1 Tax=Methanosarcina lacustris Z-7289 TaxID=1434111 RepID=A0A0E3S321_9EURY|nr:hypothetical protein [Methanosarcina lacustris]AKB73482.1 hypothetical protein MSLAZ_0221 [Methanosarcina lacustris Z-7289]